jgi:hypothetical protein
MGTRPPAHVVRRVARAVVDRPSAANRQVGAGHRREVSRWSFTECVKLLWGEMLVPTGRVRMDPLSAMGIWALSLVGIATLVCAARKAGAVHDLRHEDDGEFH